MGNSCVCRFCRSLERRDVAVALGYLLAAGVYAVLIVACAKIGGNGWLNLLLVLFGGALGWTLGVLAGAKNPNENQRLSAYAVGISTFVLGFIAAKIERLYELSLSSGLPAELTVSRALLFSTAFLIGLLCTFLGRSGAKADKAIGPTPLLGE
jgi:hypothetical protein